MSFLETGFQECVIHVISNTANRINEALSLQASGSHYLKSDGQRPEFTLKKKKPQNKQHYPAMTQ